MPRSHRPPRIGIPRKRLRSGRRRTMQRARGPPRRGREVIIQATVVRPLNRRVDERGSLMDRMPPCWAGVVKRVPIWYMSGSYAVVLVAGCALPLKKRRVSVVMPTGMIKAVGDEE